MENKFLGTGEEGYHPVRKIKVVFNGLRFALLHDFSVLYKLILSLMIVIPSFFFSSLMDVTIVILATGVMLAAEIFNTAIEAICDFMITDYNEKIGIIKDIAAAATGITIFVWVVILAIEFHKLLKAVALI
ncbi:MAG: diacylglycerol kinase [Campylobacterota bacterium]